MFLHVFNIADMNIPAIFAGRAICASVSKTLAKTTTKTV